MTSPEQMDARMELMRVRSDLDRAAQISEVNAVAIACAIAEARQQAYLKGIEDAAEVADGLIKFGHIDPGFIQSEILKLKPTNEGKG